MLVPTLELPTRLGLQVDVLMSTGGARGGRHNSLLNIERPPFSMELLSRMEGTDKQTSTSTNATVLTSASASASASTSASIIPGI